MRGLGGSEPLLQARDGFGEPLGLDGLHEVIQHPMRKNGDAHRDSMGDRHVNGRRSRHEAEQQTDQRGRRAREALEAR